MSRVLITGAAGIVGGFLRTRLTGHELTLLDVVDLDPDGVSHVTMASVTDVDAMTLACGGVDAVIHLGGLSGEAPWDDILAVNIQGAYAVLEGARRAGVRRVILASSNHAVGYHERGQDDLPDDLLPRPDTYYGVSKVAMEALGSLYHDRYGLEVICLRIGSCFEAPASERMLSTWLSPDDAARLMEACLSAPDVGFHIAWGVSANTRRWWSLDAARQLGYRPEDDSEVFAADVDRDEPDALRLVGGAFCSAAFDAPTPDWPVPHFVTPR